MTNKLDKEELEKASGALRVEDASGFKCCKCHKYQDKFACETRIVTEDCKEYKEYKCKDCGEWQR